jgi:hypothetical protein
MIAMIVSDVWVVRSLQLYELVQFEYMCSSKFKMLTPRP